MSTSYRGHTWGKVDFSETALKLCTMDDTPKSVFNIEFQSINNATINKNDIILETGAKIQDEEDCMCQIRFYVDLPKEDNQAQDDDSDSEKQKDKNKDKQGGDKDEDKPQKVNYTEVLYKKIIEKAKIGSFAGESILTLNEVNLVVPRGKYTIDFYQKNLRFHGQTYNFTIDYKNIMKGFLLPMENESQVSIILQLHKDKPIYQGQTLYRNIVLQVKKDIEVQVKTRVKDKDKQKNPNLSQIKQEYSGPLFQVLMDVIKSAAQISLIAPDSKDFKSRNGQSCVKCGVRAQPGWLYFLKRSLIFIPKPVLYFKVEDIKKVEFNRLGANNKQFDMKVTLLQQKRAVEFIGIERNQLDILIQYFKSKNVKVQMQEDVKKIKPDIGADDDDDEEDDGDFDGEGIDSQDDEDESFEQESLSGSGEKKKGKKKEKGQKKEKNDKQKGDEAKKQDQ